MTGLDLHDRMVLDLLGRRFGKGNVCLESFVFYDFPSVGSGEIDLLETKGEGYYVVYEVKVNNSKSGLKKAKEQLGRAERYLCVCCDAKRVDKVYVWGEGVKRIK